ncbi:MAG TPA: sulfurtransferase TusA family protein [Rhodospirillaceae bacterium]|nr:sulfurtransferase TusA family protein [Rhodospirillaceae bacterium]
MPDVLVDARGLLCPLPVLRAKKALKVVGPGGLVTVLATDPASVRDFRAFCQQTGCELVEAQADADGVFRTIIRNRLSI